MAARATAAAYKQQGRRRATRHVHARRTTVELGGQLPPGAHAAAAEIYDLAKDRLRLWVGDSLKLFRACMAAVACIESWNSMNAMPVPADVRTSL